MESAKRARRVQPWLSALGGAAMPPSFELGARVFRHLRTFKHDFFAATGLYECHGEHVVLKIGRSAPLFGLPLAWLGSWLACRETSLYGIAADLEGVPRSLGRVGRTGFVHEFVDGHPLQPRERVGDGFFDELGAIVAALHGRGIAYADLEKRENILVGADGRPWLIDFQISWHWPRAGVRRRGLERLVPDALGRRVLARLQAADRYHLEKHRRRHRPDQMSAEELAASRIPPGHIRRHRLLTWPLRALRRRLLALLTGQARSPKQDGPEFLDPLRRRGTASE